MNEIPDSSKSSTRLGVGIVVVVVIVILVALAWLLFWRHSSNKTTTVQITASRFVPSEITVKLDTTVTWTNTDSELHQIASDPYPINNGLPSLASAGLIPGASYSYTFRKVGVFGYHDQESPTRLLGQVKVTP